MRSIWPLVEPLLKDVERPARYIDSEWGAAPSNDASYRAALAYPDAYEVGMANQALSILYRILNDMPDVAAERTFVPWIDMADAMRRNGVPLFTLESCARVGDFDLFGITLPYELTYSNVLELLNLAGIPLRAADRTIANPLVVGGGPCAFNPEPVAPFFDAILVGEGEEAVSEIVQVHRDARDAGMGREETLRALAGISGVYVPALQGPIAKHSGAPRVPARVSKRVLADLGSFRAVTCPVVPYVDVVHDRATIEVLRGCTRGCRFCQAGMVYRPVRERTADSIVRDAVEALRCTGYEEVSLTSLSTSDHSQLEEVLRRLTRRLDGTGISISLPSLRVDAFSVDMARMVAAGRASGLTLAPEAGTQRMRDVINKNVTEEDLIGTIQHAFEAGFRRVKLYFMIGLPGETDEDIAGIGSLVGRVLKTAREAVPPDQRGSVRIGVSVSTFVPKAHTPFQWEGQIPMEEVARRQGVLRESMPRKGVDLSWHDSETSFLEGVMARGGREVADAIEEAWTRGARFDAWTEHFSLGTWLAAFEAAGLDPAAIATRDRERDDELPWVHIDSGVSTQYLWDERERALEGATTEDCSFGRCTGCGVCDDLGVDVILGGGSRGTR